MKTAKAGRGKRQTVCCGHCRHCGGISFAFNKRRLPTNCPHCGRSRWNDMPRRWRPSRRVAP